MQPDRRSYIRVKACESCKVFTSSSPVTECTAIELSEGGARLLFIDGAPRGEDLLVFIESLGQVRSGVVRWRMGQILGLEYTRDPDDLLNC